MIDKIHKIALRSSTGKYAMGCIIVDEKNRIVSNGWAHKPIMKNWKLYSLHAEMHAVARARHHYRLERGTAYIVAVSRKSGKFTTAMPCRDCAIALISFGVELVMYSNYLTNHIGSLEVGILEDMLSELKVYNEVE